jgi:hypothetical protein
MPENPRITEEAHGRYLGNRDQSAEFSLLVPWNVTLLLLCRPASLTLIRRPGRETGISRTRSPIIPSVLLSTALHEAAARFRISWQMREPGLSHGHSPRFCDEGSSTFKLMKETAARGFGFQAQGIANCFVARGSGMAIIRTRKATSTVPIRGDISTV